MYQLSRHRGRAASAFGIAFAAMLLIGAFVASAAQATATWHIDGSEYTGSESVAWTGGSTSFKAENGLSMSCAELSGTSTISEGKYDSGTLTLTKCSVSGAPQCEISPLKLSIYGELGGEFENGFETLNASASKWKISNCPIQGELFVEGTISAQIGEEAVKSSRTISSTNLKFYGQTWTVSGAATATLSGSFVGSKFGTGGAWNPAGAATWAIGGKAFSGTESVSLSKTNSVTITSNKGEVISCKSSEGKSLQISGGEFSSGQITFKNCTDTTYPECQIAKGNITLTTSGYIGLDEWVGLPRERLDVSGTVSLYECPVDGTLPVSGSIGATLSSNGLALKKQFSAKDAAYTGAPGMKFAGQSWSVSTTIETVTSGSNSGKALGVI